MCKGLREKVEYRHTLIFARFVKPQKQSQKALQERTSLEPSLTREWRREVREHVGWKLLCLWKYKCVWIIYYVKLITMYLMAPFSVSWTRKFGYISIFQLIFQFTKLLCLSYFFSDCWRVKQCLQEQWAAFQLSAASCTSCTRAACGSYTSLTDSCCSPVNPTAVFNLDTKPRPPCLDQL